MICPKHRPAKIMPFRIVSNHISILVQPLLPPHSGLPVSRPSHKNIQDYRNGFSRLLNKVCGEKHMNTGTRGCLAAATHISGLRLDRKSCSFSHHDLNFLFLWVCNLSHLTHLFSSRQAFFSVDLVFSLFFACTLL